MNPLPPSAPHPDSSKAFEVMETFLHAYSAFCRKMDRAMKAEGASMTQAELLLFIAHRRNPRAADIAASFSLAPRTITQAIDGLERAGLAVREPDPIDRRAKKIVLTDRGRLVAKTSDHLKRRHARDVIGVLNDDESAELARLLEKVNSHLAAQYDRGLPRGLN